MGIYTNYPNSIYNDGAGGGGGDVEVYLQAIVPVAGGKVLVVDENGYIGSESLSTYNPDYSYAFVVRGADFSGKGLGQVTLIDPGSADIGGRTYRTVTINGVTWLAENLDFKASGGIKIGSYVLPTTPAAWYYNNDENTYGVNGNKYGLLYNWYAVKYLNDHRDVLFPGWHVPTADEWDALANAVGGASVAGTKLKSTTGWSSGNGTDDFDFTAFPAGYYNGSFGDVRYFAFFWTASEYNSTLALYKGLRYNASSLNSDNNNKTDSYSVRLVKDSA